MQLGGHLDKTWSTTQDSVTLSSAEAELVALSKLPAEVSLRPFPVGISGACPVFFVFVISNVDYIDLVFDSDSGPSSGNRYGR